MKRILLVTLQGANYGNRLQNYALQTVMVEKGYEIDTPYYTPEQYYTKKKIIKHYIKMVLGIVGIKKYKEEILKVKKERLFQSFDKSFIKNKFFVKFGDLSKIDVSKYNCAVVGSDQVWHNWTKTAEELKYFYLTFIPADKRISYAASFGFPDFSTDFDIHEEGLKNMKFLSVREKNGHDIIQKRYGINSEVVPDPTILLDKEKWEKFAKKPDYFVNEEFAVVYFLGEITSKANTMIQQLLDRKIQVINLMNYMDSCYLSTPNNFIWLIKHSKYVLTDSFHACVFSVMFSKKFVVFERKDKYVTNMFDRIEHLLNMTNSVKYYEKNVENIDALENILPANAEKELNNYRKCGMQFLNDALEKMID